MLDVIILGSGPAGMGAAIYAGRANLSYVVLEKDYEGKGQIVYSDRVDNYLGLNGLNGYDLGETMRQHALSMGTSFEDGTVRSIEKCDGFFKVNAIDMMGDEKVLEGKTILIATGASHRHLGIEGEASHIGKGVSYCATCDGAFYRNKTVAVIGGGDTALNDALYLAGLSQKVYLIHRRKEFRGARNTVELVKKNEKIELLLEATPEKILGDLKVTGLTLQDGRSLDVDGVFVAVGMVPETKLVEDLVELDEAGYIVASEDGITSCPGIFVAGDARTKKLRQVITAVSDGANAMESITEYLR